MGKIFDVISRWIPGEHGARGPSKKRGSDSKRFDSPLKKRSKSEGPAT